MRLMQTKTIEKEKLDIPVLKEDHSEKIDSPQKLFKNIREEILEEKRECLGIVLLDAANSVLWNEVIHLGTVDSAICHPREVFRPAISKTAVRVVVVHNHPSNRLAPSPEDINAAGQLEASGELIGIPLTDFVIVGKDDYLSFARYGLMGEKDEADE